jgi:hypothetical protein
VGIEGGTIVYGGMIIDSLGPETSAIGKASLSVGWSDYAFRI